MQRGFHYTTLSKYRSIEKKGVLESSSELIPPSWQSRVLGVEFPDERYTFAFLDNAEPESWKQGDFLNYLLHIYIAGGKGSFLDRLVLLSFPLEGEEAHILEAKFMYNVTKNIMTPSEGFRGYVQSMVRVEEYKGGYEMPELAVASDIPFEKIRLESVNPRFDSVKKIGLSKIARLGFRNVKKARGKKNLKEGEEL